MDGRASTLAGRSAAVLSARIEALDVPALRRTYLAAAPWPHVVLDGLFDDELLDAALDEVRALDEERMEQASTRNMVKRETADPALLGPATLALLDQMNGPILLDLIARLTAIPDLEPDPVRHWAGVHETPPGGFTKVHVDFDRHPESGLYHRTNALLYLNREWDLAWGGQLELWPADMSAVGTMILPLANRLVVFETNASTFHGLPAPVDTPDGRSRLSLAAYQFSPTPPAPTGRRRLSKYAARPEDDWRVGLPSRWDLRDRLPTPVRAAARGLLRGVRKMRR
jgi:hypothetical protein